MREELKEAFRIYDRDGEGFITTDVLKVKKYIVKLVIQYKDTGTILCKTPPMYKPSSTGPHDR